MIKTVVDTPGIPNTVLGATAVDCADDEYQLGADMDGSDDEDQPELKVVATPKTKPPKKTKVSIPEQVNKITEHEDSEDEMEVRIGKRKAQSNISITDDQL